MLFAPIWQFDFKGWAIDLTHQMQRSSPPSSGTGGEKKKTKQKLSTPDTGLLNENG